MPFGLFKTKNNTVKEPEKESFCDGTRIVNISPKLIVPNPSQPRCNYDEDAIVSLADSISKYGFIQPLVVRLTEEGTYELVVGERRLRAARLLCLERVPCIISTHGIDRRRSAELAIVENTQRENLDFFEQASAIRELMRLCSYTQSEVAERLSLSQPAVANKLRLLKLAKPERTAIIEAELTERHARAMLGAPPERRMLIISLSAGYSLNVSQTETLCAFAAENTSVSDEVIESEARRIKCRYDGVNNNMKKTSRKNSSPSEEKKCVGLKIAIRNLDIFVNSFEHLAELAEKTGAVVEKSICETDCGIEFRLSISTADGDNAV